MTDHVDSLQPLSLRAYALRRGVSAEAVSKAVAAGRLDKSVARDKNGAPKIADPDLADREWEANTRQRIDRPADIASSGDRVSLTERNLVDLAARERHGNGNANNLPDGVPAYNVSQAVRAAAAARREVVQADLAEFELAAKRGRLIDADQARADVIAAYSVVKTRLLAVPSRVAQRLPHVARAVVPVVDELIREALEELSAGDA